MLRVIWNEGSDLHTASRSHSTICWIFIPTSVVTNPPRAVGVRALLGGDDSTASRLLPLVGESEVQAILSKLPLSHRSNTRIEFFVRVGGGDFEVPGSAGEMISSRRQHWERWAVPRDQANLDVAAVDPTTPAVTSGVCHHPPFPGHLHPSRILYVHTYIYMYVKGGDLGLPCSE